MAEVSSTDDRVVSDRLTAADDDSDSLNADIADFDRDQTLSPVERVHRFLHGQPVAGPAIVLVGAIIVFSFLSDTFFASANFSLIVQQTMTIGILGIGQTIVILTAGIDLSVGAMMVLTSVVMGKLAVEQGFPAPLAIAIGFAVGALLGWINGTLVTKVKLPPFIVTLGTWQIFFAVNLWYSGSETLRSQDVEREAWLLRWLGRSFEIVGTRITYGSVLMLAMFVVFWYVMKWTAWGQHVYAVGDDAEAARLSGIRRDRVLRSAYIVAGVVSAVAAWALIGRTGSVSPQSGQDANLDSISAVVIGGTSLFGGRGRIVGTLVGALTVGVFRSGLVQAGVDVLWQNFAIGILIIVAVSIDQWIRKVVT